MDIQVYHGGTDITDKVITYNRDQRICTGIGLLDLTVEGTGLEIDPWDEIIVYENGEKKGTYIVATSGRNHTGEYEIECQDYSKRLQDYFVAKLYPVPYPSYTKTFIKKFLDLAKVDYTFTASGNGTEMIADTEIGMDTAYNLVVQLLQQSGWYIYFNANGRAIVGSLNKSKSDPDESLDKNDILSIKLTKDDKMLRNRAVVWGGTDPVSFQQIFVDISKNTPYNYDSKDKRAVVMGNSYIRTYADASNLARTMLDEFARITHVKILELYDDHNLGVGDIVFVQTNEFSGSGLITSTETRLSANGGYVHTLYLDERCPRMFTFYSPYNVGPPYDEGDYVYVGTWGAGIWKRYTFSTTWVDFSDGLENLFIKDMFIRGGVFVAIADDGFAYYRTAIGTAWTKFVQPNMYDLDGTLYAFHLMTAVACSVNELGNIIIAYNYRDYTPIRRSWILEINSQGTIVSAEMVYLDEFKDVHVVDLEAAGEYNMVSAELPLYFPEFYEMLADLEGGIADRTHNIAYGNSSDFYFNPNTPDYRHYYGAIPDGVTTNAFSASVAGTTSEPLFVGNRIYAFSTSEGKFVKIDMDTKTKTEYSVSNPITGEVVVYTEDELTFYLSTATYDNNAEEFHFNSYSYTLGDTELVPVGSQTSTDLDPIGNRTSGFVFMAPYWFIAYAARNPTALAGNPVYRIKVCKFNVVTGSGETSIWASIPGEASVLDSGNPLYPPCGSYKSRTNFQLANLVLEDAGVISIFAGYAEFVVDECWWWPNPPMWLWDGYQKAAGVFHATINVYPDGTISDAPADVSNSVWFLINKSGDDKYPQMPTSLIAVRKSGAATGYTFGTGYLSTEIIKELDPDHNYEIHLWTWEITPNTISKANERKLSAPAGEVSFDPTGIIGSIRDSVLSFGVGGVYISGRFHSAVTVTELLESSTPIEIGGRTGPPTATGEVAIWSLPNYGLIGTFYKNSPGGVLNASVQIGDNSGWIADLTTAHIMDDADNTVYFLGHMGNFQRWLCGYNLTTGSFTKQFGPVSDFSYPFLGPGFIGTKTLGGGTSFYWPGEIVDDYRYVILNHTSAPRGYKYDHIYIPGPGWLETFVPSGYLAYPGALEETIGYYDLVHETENPCKVEISPGGPTTIFSVPSGTTDFSELGYSYTNASGSFVMAEGENRIWDARNFTLINPQTYPIEGSGSLPAAYVERYLAVAASGAVNLTTAVLGLAWTPLITLSGITMSGLVPSGTVFSGIISKIETSNYTNPDPYFFVALSGQKLFLQRNFNSPYWHNYTNGLPDSQITIIRMDDTV